MQELKNVVTTNIPQNTTEGLTTSILSWLFAAVGMLAVVMIIVSGLKMTLSAGDPGAVAKAKLTLVYSIVGLVVAMLAYAIVTFVIGSV